MVRSQHLCRESMSATPALQVYSTAAMSRSFLSAVVGSGRETVLNVCLVVEEYLNYWNGFYCSFARWPPVTQKTVASLKDGGEVRIEMVRIQILYAFLPLFLGEACSRGSFLKSG